VGPPSQTVLADPVLGAHPVGHTADGAKGRYDGGKFLKAGEAEQEISLIGPGAVLPEKGTAHGASGGIDKVNELPEKIHGIADQKAFHIR